MLVGALERQLKSIEQRALDDIGKCGDRRAVQDVRVRLLGKKGELTRLLRSLADLPADERPDAGASVNRTKTAIQGALEARDREIDQGERAHELASVRVDVTLPAFGPRPGHVHPISQAMHEICDILCSLGFSIADGPEIEDEYHNFEALNIPADHPARDMQDTFFTEDGRVLRTHTSPVQVHVMEAQPPPLRIIAPGAVYRHDDDVTHSPMFHQVEGLMVDRGVTFGHLKHVLTVFLRSYFDETSGVRFRPSYFPFTEPSAEVDIGCVLCGGSGRREGSTCRVCKGSGWLEILGCGMVDPAVFEHVGYDGEEYTGFAFGVGVDRLAMLKYGVDDLRLVFGGDLRFLEQF